MGLVDRLKQYNTWRRGETDDPQPNPTQLGKDIDEAIAKLAALEAENKAYDLRMDNDAQAIAELQADQPPDGFPSREDWLAARGFSIILEQASEDSRSWQVFDFDGEIGEPFPDYPAALAAAMKEAK